MKLKITVHGVAYEVDVEVLDAKRDEFGSTGSLPARPGSRREQAPAPAAAPAARPQQSAPTATGSGVSSPIAGTVVEVKCKAGDEVTEGQELLVIEAMKMNTSIVAPVAGKIKAVLVAASDSVRESQQLVDFE